MAARATLRCARPRLWDGLPVARLAQEGHRPVGVDLSPEMVRRARAKLAAAGFEVPVLVGDASDPPSQRPLVSTMRVEQLTDPDLWGRPIDDERYAVIAMR